jgi:hypothetical protein
MSDNAIKILTQLGGLLFWVGILLALGFKSALMLCVTLPGAAFYLLGHILSVSNNWQGVKRD